jgi:hypothetical protein
VAPYGQQSVKTVTKLIGLGSGPLALLTLAQAISLSYDGPHEVMTYVGWYGLSGLLATIAIAYAIRSRQGKGDRASSPADEAGQSSRQIGGDHSTNIAIEQGSVAIHPVASSAGTPEVSSDISFDRALANALTELQALGLRLHQAEETGYLPILPADHHQPLADQLTDQRRHESRLILDSAYNACDALRHRLREPSRRWEAGPFPELKTPAIEPGDDLPAVIAAVDRAIEDLRGLQRSDSGDRGGQSESGLQFGSIEVAEPRQVSEPNVFTEDWVGSPVTFNLVNPRGGTRARAVRPTVTVRDPEGNQLAGPANARWANPQGQDTQEVERDIPANGAPVAIDTVIQPIGEGRFWLVTDDGLLKGIKGAGTRIDSGDIRVTVAIQGENVPEISETVRVRIGFPKPALGDEEPSDTLLPPDPAGPQDDQSESSNSEGSDEVSTSDPEESVGSAHSEGSTLPRESVNAELDKLYVEGKRMLKVANPLTSISASVLYGQAPTEAAIDRWQGRVRQILPPAHKRRFRFAPLEAQAREPVTMIGKNLFEIHKEKRLRESLAELERIMEDLDNS